MVTCTSTGPDALNLLALGGYRGCALLITPPHVTDPNIFSPSPGASRLFLLGALRAVFCCVGGAGDGGLGGGGASIARGWPSSLSFRAHEREVRAKFVLTLTSVIFTSCILTAGMFARLPGADSSLGRSRSCLTVYISSLCSITPS